MATKRFQVLSEGFRLQAIVDTPEQGDSWPLVILSHPAQKPKDSAFFDPLVPGLLARGLAVCRYDPRGFGQSEGAAASTSFWTRWLDLTAVTLYTADEMDFVFEQRGLAGFGFGAVLSLWWAAVHTIRATVALGLPPAKKLGSIPRAMQDLLPMEYTEKDVVPHPTGITNGLLLYGERDKCAELVHEPGVNLGLKAEVIPGADKNFSQIKPRQEAFQRTTDWLARYLVKVPAHEHEPASPGEESERLPKEPAQE